MPLERLNLSLNTKKKISRKLGLDSVCFFISNLMLLANLFWTLVHVVTFTGPPYLSLKMGFCKTLPILKDLAAGFHP